MTTIIRILKFKKHDWKHIFWLVGRMANGYWNGNLEQIVDAWLWIRFHCENDSMFIPSEESK